MNRSAPWLAVVIPALDADRTIAAAALSVLGQTDSSELEVIVVDDGSRDATREVVESLGDSRLRILDGPRRGAAAARNVGLRVARAPWVAFLDADDRWRPGNTEALRYALKASPHAVACFGAARHVQEDGRLIRVFAARRRHATMEGLLKRRLQPTTSATVVGRDVALSLGGFDEGFRRPAGVEDVDLWWRLADRGPCTVQPEPLCEYVVHLARDRQRSRADLLDLTADRERCVERLRGAVDPALFRFAAAQHHAVLARYWLLADYRLEARGEARRALRYRITRDGLAVLTLALLPLRASRAVRQMRRLGSRLAERA